MLPSPVREVLEAELEVRVAHLGEFKACFPELANLLIWLILSTPEGKFKHNDYTFSPSPP